MIMFAKLYQKNTLELLKLYYIVLFLFASLLKVVQSQGFYDCRLPLGMVSGDIKDSQIYSASVYNNNPAFNGSWARLGRSGGYRADSQAQQSWIMVQFPKATIVTGIATQGFNHTTIDEWVVTYYLGFTSGAKSGFFLTQKGSKNAMVFDGNSDSNSIVLHYVPVPETVNTISIMPIKWHNNFAVRFELYGCLADGYECISTPCQNNGTCTDLVAGYYCNCTAGFTGVNCQIDIDDCVGVTCLHGGNCTDLINDYSCDCPPGYSGKHCETDINECQSHPCKHGGTCADLVNDYKCACTEDFGGKDCQEAAGIFLVVWLQIKNNVFITPFLDNNSIQYRTTAALVKDQTTKMLQNEEGFLSAEIRNFSPGDALTAEVEIRCLINSTGLLKNTTNHVVTNGYSVFKDNFVEFEDRGTSECKPANITLNLSRTMATATDVSRYQNTTIRMQATLSCTMGGRHSYRVDIYSINNITAAFTQVYTIVGLLSNFTTWAIPARALQFGVHYVKVTSAVSGRTDTNSVSWGLISVGETKLVSKIMSRNVTYQGAKTIFILNGSQSYDPDLGPGIYKDMEFIWLCRRSNESFPNKTTSLTLVSPNDTQSGRDHGGCYGSGVGRLEPTKKYQYVVGLDVDKMRGNTGYVVALVIKKQERSTWSEKKIYVKEEIDISLVCVQNCKSSVIPSERLVLKKRCEGLLCNKITSYEWILKTFNTDTNQWTLLPDISDYMLTYMNSPTMVTKENKLLGNSSYILTLTAKAPGNIIDTTRYRFDTNAPPSGGRCEVDLKEGEAWLTYFTFTCSGWEDQNLPLSYKFRYFSSDEIGMVFSSGKSPTARAKLTVGNKAEDYRLNIQIQVSDSIGSEAVVKMFVKVVEPKIQNANLEDAVGANGDIEKYLKDNNIEMAAQHATSVLSVVNNAPHKELALKRKIKIKDSVVKSWSSITVKNLDEVGQVSAVVSAASDRKTEVSMESQGSLVSLLENMASVLDKEAENSKDGQELAIQNVGTGLLQGIGNIMDVAAWNASVSFDYFTSSRRKKRAIGTEYKNQKSIALVSKTMNLVDKVADSLVKTKKLYEKPTVFKTKSMSMILDRQRPDLIGGKEIQDGDTRIVLPSSDSLTQNDKDSFLSSQLVSMTSNPFTWDSSAEDIKSSVLDLKLKSSNGANIDINNLNQDFSLFIPVKAKDKAVNLEAFFVKPSINGSMQYHVINIPGKEYAVSIQLRPLSSVNITIYVRYSSRPTVSDFNYTATVPDYQTCNYTYTEGYFNCTTDPYTVTLSSTLTGHTGIHYLGVVYWKRENGTTQNDTISSQNGVKSGHSRTKRDCFSDHSRHKRSLCVQVKDAPPTKPTSLYDVPSYNPASDVNYTLSVTMATCLFWDVASHKWTSKGCKVGPQSRVGQLHCLCNHLTSFGGNFFVAPNPIDFNKVQQRFTDFDAKNFVVFIVVFGIFGLYLLALVFVRRADQRDEVKAFETLRLSSSAGRNYEISIYTGMWRNNGTTANVGLKIFGHQGESNALYLSDRYTKRQLFARASINTFMTSLPESIGDIMGIKLWHDNEGDSPSWYVNQVVIRDLQNDDATYIICKRWLAVDKEDGEVQANFPVATKEELSSFSYQFSTRISKSLGDGHLWLSVATRPPHSPFTRVQRVSCCLSVLFCAMVASAMFYQFGAKDTSSSYKFGALRFSIRQLMIGIQSALVIVPLNILIVTIFRNVKPPRKTYGRRYSPKDQQPKTPGCLPHFFVYVGWFLCVCSIAAAGTFTILYSLSWGGEVANQWLTSVLIAFVQDIGVIQPIKVVALAIILALIIKKPQEEKTSHSLDKADLDVNPHATVEPLEDEKLNGARSYSRSLLKTFRAVGEIAAYLLFVFCLFVFVYQNRGYDRYHLKRSIDEIFVPSFNEIGTIEEFWTWAKEEFVPGLYDTKWYNSAGSKLPEGFISSKEAFLVGMPRFRQIRLNPVSPCEVSRVLPWTTSHFTSCLPSYEHEHEETTRYNLPGWIPVTNTSIYGTLVNLRRVCPKPWRYQSSKELNTFNIHGVQMEYDGGGYVADLGYNSQTALRVINALESDHWFDRRTVLLLAEFTVYEPSSSLFSHAKFIIEMVPATGKPLISTKIETLSLYASQSSSFRRFFVAIQILLLVFIFFYLIAEVVKLMRSRCSYFTSFWNWMDLIQLLSAITATVLFFFKANFVSSFIRNVQANPYETTSIDYVLLWCNLELYVISVVIFVVTIKFLRLLRFNRHICQMTASMKHSFGCITTYTFVFLIDMISFGFLGVLVFGPVVKEYSNLVDSLRSLFQKFLGGDTLFEELVTVNRIIGPLFVIVYMITMTFILVNMFVAILNDSYESVRTLTGGKFPDSDLGAFMKEYYKRQFRLTHDVLKRKLGKIGYRAKLYDPKKEEEKEDIQLDNNGELIGYSWLGSKKYYPGQTNGGFVLETNTPGNSEQIVPNGIVNTHNKGKINAGFSTESVFKPISEDEPLLQNEDNVFQEPVADHENQSLESLDVTIETETSTSVATRSSTPELLDLISDLPESLVDDEDTVDVVREKLSNVGAILRLSKRSYRRFSTSGDKFVVQRQFNVGKPVELTFTPKMTRKLNINLE